MTAEAILDSLRRANPVCVICHGASSHPPIVGDGPPRCYPCILALGRIAGFPMDTEPDRLVDLELAQPDRLVDLELAHHDVVSLQPCPVHVGGCWRWDGWL